MRELLVEVTAEAIQLFRLAYLLGGDGLIMPGHKRAVIRPARFILSVSAGSTRLRRRFRIPHFRIIGVLRRQRLRSFGAGIGHILARHVRFVDLSLRVLCVRTLATFARLLLAAVLAFLAFLLIGFGVAVLAHIERIEQIVDGSAKTGLILDQPLEAIEIPARSVLDQGAPKLDQFFGSTRRGLAGEPLAYEKGDCLLDRGIRAIKDFVELAAMETVVEHARKIFGYTRHTPGPKGFDPRLLHRIEHRPRLLPSGDKLAMDQRIVTGELERDRIGVPAQHGSIRETELARRLGQARLPPNHSWPFSCERDLQIRLSRNSAQAARHGAFERLGRILPSGTLALDV